MREMAIVSRQRATGEVGREKRRGHADGVRVRWTNWKRISTKNSTHGKPEDKSNITTSAGGSEAGTSASEPRAAPTLIQPKGKGGKGPKGPIPTRPPKQTMMVKVQGESTTATGMVKPVREVSDSARVRTSAPSSLEPKVTRSVGPENSRATVGKAPGNNGSAPAMSVGGDGPTVLTGKPADVRVVTTIGGERAGTTGYSNADPVTPSTSKEAGDSWILVEPRHKKRPANNNVDRPPQPDGKGKRPRHRPNAAYRRKMRNRQLTQQAGTSTSAPAQNPPRLARDEARRNAAETINFETVTSDGTSNQAGSTGSEDHTKASKRSLDETSTPRGEHKKMRTVTPLRNYAAATKSEIIAAITTANVGHLSRSQADEVQELLMKKLRMFIREHKPPPEERPVFQGKPTYIDGSLQVGCTNMEAMKWLKTAVDGVKLSSDVCLKVCKPSEMVRRTRCGILIPEQASARDIGESLKYFNSWAAVERWTVYATHPQEAGTFAIVGIPDDIIPALLERGRKMAYMLGTVYVRFEVRKGRFSITPPQHLRQSTPEGNSRMDTEAPTPVANTVQEPSSPASTLLDESEDALLDSQPTAEGDAREFVAGWTGGLEELNLSTGEDGEESPLI
ncbi:hypothetical protein ACJJTC_016228 [Scirpophaga incertulas]